MKNKQLSNIPVVRIVGTTVAVALMGYLLLQQDWKSMRLALANVELWRFLVAIGLMFISRICYVARWHFLVRSAGFSFSFWTSARLTFAGLFSNNFLPTTVGGDVVRLAGTVQQKQDAVVSAASLIMDRLVGMFSMAFLLPFGISALLGATVAQSSLSLALPAFFQKAYERVKKLVLRVWEAFLIWKDKPTDLLLSLIFNFIHIIAILLFFIVLLHGMNEDVSMLRIGGLWCLVYFITLLPISINGWGLQEASMASLFITYGNVSPESAWGIAFLFRFAMMFASLPGVFFVSDILPDLRKNN